MPALKNSLASIGLIMAAALVPLGAQADVIETLQAAPGTDLSDLVAGDTFQLETVLTSTDPGEHFTGPVDVHIFGFEFIQFGDPNPQLQLTQLGMITQTSSDLSVTPEIVTWTYLALGPGSDELWNGWSDCDPAAGPTGCAVTNLGFTRPADTNHLTFDVQRAPPPSVPEPGTLALCATSLLTAGGWLLRRRARK